MSFALRICLLFVGCILQTNFTEAQYGACTTPNRERANCVELNQCQELYDLLQNPNISPSDRNYLSRSQCGYVNNKVLVCCSNRPRASTYTSYRPSSIPRSAGTLPKPPQCGISLTDRIVGGVNTDIFEFPWMALIEYTKPGNRRGHHCGGTLISNRYVLTAAHCLIGAVIPPTWGLTGVRLGEWDTTTNPDCNQSDCAPEYLDVRVESKIPHPEYERDSADQFNDIALLRLADTVTPTDHIKPICLPVNSNVRDFNFVGTVMDVAGWGRTESESASTIKKRAEVKVWESGNCSEVYRTQYRNLDASQVCAGGEDGVDSCRGDSGGPLMVQLQENGRNAYYLIGVVSYGPSPCGLKGWPGVYTRVGAFIDWIQNNIN